MMEPREDRREFLAVAAKFSSVATILGLGGKTVLEAGGVSAKRPIIKLLDYAVETGDMNTAIKKYSEQIQLNSEQLKALNSLTRGELTTIKTVRKKLKPLGKEIAGAYEFYHPDYP
jgi:hypothetical protein